MTDPIERVASWVIKARDQALPSFASGGVVDTIVPFFDTVICEAGQHPQSGPINLTLHLGSGAYKLSVEQVKRIGRMAECRTRPGRDR